MTAEATDAMIPAASDCSLAETVAPEDLCVGDYVAILNEINEYPSFLWCRDPELNPPHEPIRVQWRACDGGKPFKVRAVCLPFVLLKNPNGKHKSIDIRGVQLVRLSREYAKRTWSVMRKKRKRRRRRKKRLIS